MIKYILNFLLLSLLVFFNALASQTVEDNALVIGDPNDLSDVEIGFPSAVQKLKLNRSSGKIQFTKDGTIFKDLGSGSGGGAGAISIIANSGFEDGVDSEWSYTSGTVSAALGSNALLGEVSAVFDPAALNDYLRTSYFTVPKGLRGAACEARFLYTGGDALNYSAKVETQSGVVLGTYMSQSGANVLPYHNSTAGYESVFFKCPTEADVVALGNNGNIRLVVYQGTATNAAAIVMDDVHFGGLIGLVESALPDTLSGVISSAGAVSSSSLSGWYTVSKGATGLYTINFAPNIFTVAPSCRFSADQPSSPNNNIVCSQVDTPAASASSVSVRCSQVTTNLDRSFTFSCDKQGVDAKQSVQVYKSIPRITSNTNIYPVKMGAGGVVTGDDFDVINGNCALSGTSNESKTCTYNSGIFTVPPIVMATACDTAIFDRNVTISSPTASGFSATTRITTNGSADNGVCFMIMKVGTDFKMPTVQPMVIGQVTNSVAESGLTNIRTEYCYVNNAGSASTSSVSGLCDSWLQSVSRTATGAITHTFKTGIFSSGPICHCTSNSGTSCTIPSVNGTSNFVTNTYTGTTGLDAGVFISCTGKR